MNISGMEVNEAVSPTTTAHREAPLGACTWCRTLGVANALLYELSRVAKSRTPSMLPDRDFATRVKTIPVTSYGPSVLRPPQEVPEPTQAARKQSAVPFSSTQLQISGFLG